MSEFQPDAFPTYPELPASEDDQIDILIADPVARYRAEQLAAAGYTPQQSRVLALARDVDLHQAVGLIGKGCDPNVAFDILS